MKLTKLMLYLGILLMIIGWSPTILIFFNISVDENIGFFMISIYMIGSLLVFLSVLFGGFVRD